MSTTLELGYFAKSILSPNDVGFHERGEFLSSLQDTIEKTIESLSDKKYGEYTKEGCPLNPIQNILKYNTDIKSDTASIIQNVFKRTLERLIHDAPCYHKTSDEYSQMVKYYYYNLELLGILSTKIYIFVQADWENEDPDNLLCKPSEEYRKLRSLLDDYCAWTHDLTIMTTYDFYHEWRFLLSAIKLNTLLCYDYDNTMISNMIGKVIGSTITYGDCVQRSDRFYAVYGGPETAMRNYLRGVYELRYKKIY